MLDRWRFGRVVGLLLYPNPNPDGHSCVTLAQFDPLGHAIAFVGNGIDFNVPLGWYMQST